MIGGAYNINDASKIHPRHGSRATVAHLDGHLELITLPPGSVYFAFPGSFDGALLRRIADSKQIWAPGGYGFPSALNAHFASLYAQKAQKNGLDFPKGVLIRDALTGEALTPASIKADAAASY